MHTNEESRRTSVRNHAPDEQPPSFEELAARLNAIASRAAEARWRGWTPEDTEAISMAAREIRAIPEALATGMKDAFKVGRQYGRGEEELADLNMEIDALSRKLAAQAWGGGRSGLA